MNHSVRRLSVCAARASSRAACSPLLQTPRALPHPPSGATAAPSATTSRAGASACPYARGGTTHPSAARPPGTARTRSRRSGPLPRRLVHPAPPASAPPFASRPAALADLSEVDRAVRQDPRRCSASLHRAAPAVPCQPAAPPDRKSTRLNSSHANISYAVFCLKKKKKKHTTKIYKKTKNKNK